MPKPPHGPTAVVAPEPLWGVETLAVIYRSPATLHPDPRNARTHSKHQIQQIEASIRSFGFTNPILIDEAGVIIAGHGRLRAAKNIEMASVPTITLGGLTDAQRRALRLADNKIALGAGWDTEILKLELAELGTLDRLCCTNLARDSSCESSVIAWMDEQTEHPELQDPELARV